MAVLSVFGFGCANNVTFPGDSVPSAVESVAKELYEIDVLARVAGKTVGVMVYADQLIDDSGKSLAEGTQELIGNLMLTVTRVALSTDRAVDFVVVAIRQRDQPLELRLTRYLTDIKRAQTEALPMTESINRTVWENKQYTPDKADPTGFTLKEVMFEDFLSEQIVQRLRYQKVSSKDESDEDEKDATTPERLVEGKFRITMQELREKRVFEFSILAFADFHSDDHTLDVLKMISNVFEGYEFDGFDELWVRNLLGRTMLQIDPSTLQRYQSGQLTDATIRELIIHNPAK